MPREEEEPWWERAKKLRGRPYDRLAVAEEHLPSPGALAESWVALRAIIRSKGKKGESYDGYLCKLHLRLCQHSFIFDPAYCKELRVPSYNVWVSIPSNTINDLDFPYSEIGFEHTGALKTDRKWFVENWGEPKRHQLPRSYHSDVWDKAQQELGVMMKEQMDKLKDKIHAIHKACPGLTVEFPDRTNKS